MGHAQRFVRSFIVFAVGLFGACSGDRPSEGVDVLRQELSSNARILSFENVSADWTTNIGTIVSTTERVEGSYAMSTTNTQSGERAFSSVPLSNLGTGVGSSLSIDIKYPSPVPNPGWIGTIKVVLVSPTLQMWWASLPEQPENLHAPYGEFVRYTFAIPSEVQQKLRGQWPNPQNNNQIVSTYNDLTVKVFLNVPNGTWLIDRIHLGQPDEFTDAGAPDSGSSSTSDGGPSSGGNDSGVPDAGGGQGGTGSASGGSAGSGGGGSAGTDVEFKIVTPKGVSPSQVALGAEWHMRVNDGVEIRKEDGTCCSSVSRASKFFDENSASMAETWIGSQADVQNLWSNGPVNLRNNAVVWGDLISSVPIHAETPGPGTFGGAVIENAVLEPPNVLRWNVRFPDQNQGSIQIEPDQRYPAQSGSFLQPGAYGQVNIKSRAKLYLKSGTYTFREGIIAEPDAELQIDNSQGPVFIYTLGYFVYNAKVIETDPSRNNILFGVGNASNGIGADWKGILVSPDLIWLSSAVAEHSGSVFASSIILHQWSHFRHRPFDLEELCEGATTCGGLCACGPGGQCTFDSDCEQGLTCEDGTCDCAGSCSGKACGEDNGCGEPCGCVPGQTPCDPNGGCAGELGCFNDTCVVVECFVNPSVAGCGYEGAPCGEECTPQPTCTSDADCPDGFACPEESNGWRFGVPGVKVCIPDDGCGPEDCGTAVSECGACAPEPDCDDKECGDADLSDGLGGRCPATCEPGEVGCELDVDCTAGYVCRDSVCRPADPCSLPTLAPPDCGGPQSLCGACPGVPSPSCEDRECGPDPETGANCGSCGSGRFCNAAGYCALYEQTPPISVPTPGGGARTVMPETAPAAPSPFGATDGAFSVTDRGSASYAVPIDLPPGRMGMQPDLTLRYTSSTANGALGIGWSLDGLSMIARCPRTYAQDGYTRPIRGDSSDAFCLDGQRLVSVGANEFRTAVDTFTKVLVSTDGTGGPLWFKVYTKDGRILTFGGSPSSKQILRGSIVSAWALSRVEDRSGNYIRVVYQRTNRQDEVTGELATGEMVPSAITYAGGSDADGDREIVFSYTDDREDTLSGYRTGGGRLLRTKRLATVDVRAQNQLVRRYTLTYEQAPNGVSRLASLQECSGPTALACKVPTFFTYYDEGGFDPPEPVELPNLAPFGIVTKTSSGYDQLDMLSVRAQASVTTPIPVEAGIVVSFVPAIGPYAGAVAGLINAFGQDQDVDLRYNKQLLDLVAGYGSPSPVCGGHQMPTRHPFANGLGGKEDIYDKCPTKKVKPWPHPLFPDNERYKQVYFTPREWLVDVDGDGVQDKLFCSSDESAVSYKLANSRLPGQFQPGLEPASPPLYAGEGNSDGSIEAFGKLCTLDCEPPPTTIIGPHGGVIAAGTGICSADQPFSTVFDVNGDGAGELVTYDLEQGWAALTFENGVPSWHREWFEGLSITAEGLYDIKLIDANGDGLRDILALPEFYHAHEGGVAMLAENTGAGFRQSQLVAPTGDPGFVWAARYSPDFVVDLDGDGIEELFQPNSGPSTAPTEWVVRRPRTGQLPNAHVTDLVGGPGVPGDFDGDGDLDVLTRSTAPFIGDAFPWLLHRGKGYRQNLLKKVTDGLGRQVDIEYENGRAALNPLGEEVYAKTVPGSCNWPYRCLPKIDHALVSAHVESHFEDQARTLQALDRQFSYTYRSARSDAAGYGWLGFAERTVTIQDGVGDLLRRTTIEYGVPPAEWNAANAPFPYVYTTLGLPVRVIEESPEVEGLFDGDVLSEQLVTDTSITWEEKTSSAGLPFPFMTHRATQTYALSFGFRHDLFRQEETFAPDAFGNVVSASTVSFDTKASAVSGWTAIPGSGTNVTVNRQFDPTSTEVADWLISRPKSEGVISTPRCSSPIECGAKAKSRHSEFEYYDGTTLLRFVHRELGKPEFQRTTEVLRDTFGNVTHTITSNAEGDRREVEIEYDDRHLYPTEVSRIGEGGAQTTQVRYDDRFGEVAVSADPNGIDSASGFDEHGVLRRARGPSGASQFDYAVSNLYESGGMEIPAAYRVSVARDGGASSETDYNALGQPVARRSSGLLGATVFEELGYDVRNRLVARNRPHLDGDSSQSVITYGYDALDRLVEEFYPHGPEVHYEYALRDNVEFFSSGLVEPDGISYARIIDPRGNVTVQATNREGQPVALVDALGERTRYSYGAFGQPDRITDPADRTITIASDAWGRVTSVNDAARGGTEISDYNGLDELVRTEDAAGRTQEFFYDDFGRLARLEDADGVTEWIFDGDGPNEIGRLVETVSSSGQRTTFGYEPPGATRNRGLPIRVTEHLAAPSGASGDPRELATAYHFDAFSRLERIDYPAASSGSSSAPFSVAYAFDAAGNPFKAHDPATSDVYWELLEADQGYRIKKERLGTHSCGSATGTTTTRGYEQASGRLSSIQTTCGTSVLQHLTYGYDDADNLTLRTDHRTGQSETFGYDPLNRLLSINGVTTHAYDPQRGRLNSQQTVGAYTYEPDGRDWLASAGNPALGFQNFEHDAVGNIIERSGPGIPGGTQTLDYTAFDLPKSITSGTGGSATVTQFAYDAGGTRAVKETPNATTFYAGDLYQRTETASSTSHRFMIYAGGRAVAQVTRDDSSSNPTVRALHDDLLGSVHTISENGALQAGRDYAPFGPQRASGGLESQVPYGFTGHESDADLGLVNMKGRMYDPHIGQFLSADPVVSEPYSQGLNRFAYVNNSPLNFVDPSGFTGKPLEEDQAWALPATIGGGMFIAGGGLQATGGALGSAASSAASVVSTVGSGIASTLGPAIGNIWLAMTLPSSTTTTSTVKMTGSRGGTGVGAPARYRGAGQDIAPVQEAGGGTIWSRAKTTVGRTPDKLWWRTGREERLAEALKSPTPVTLGCNFVQCVDPSKAPADVVARARGWVYIFGHSPSLREIGAVDVISSEGELTLRFGVRGSTPDTVAFLRVEGDTILQFNHTHLPVHAPFPSSFDANLVLNNPGSAIATYRPASDTLNIMWQDSSGVLRQTFVSPEWDISLMRQLYP